tara:strand:+ start:24326 stop:24877 length:552 start_codon:yes stop_codon:yes gene_type:complete
MKFKKGDKVAVLDATLKGIVTAVADDQITFEEDSGFEMSYDKKLLVKITQDQGELSKYSDINNPLFREKTIASNKRKSIPKKNKREGVIPPMEVDLHIQHLVKSQKGMHNFDMLTVQIDTAKYKLEFAIRKRIPRVVFIHGVGEGVLQKELEYLFAKYPVRITEASYQKYGLGATEVYILQNK